MDGIIFEDPSKQGSRPKKSSRLVPSPGEGAAHDGVTQTQKRESILQSLDRSNHDTGDDETACSGQVSLNDLFDLSEDEHSTNNDDVVSDDLFSHQEQNEQAMDSDTSVGSASGGLAKSIPRDHSSASDQAAPGDNHSDLIIPEDGESGLGITERSTSREHELTLEHGRVDSRIPLSTSDLGRDDIVRNSQRNDDGVNMYGSAPTHRGQRHNDRNRVGEQDDDSLFGGLSEDDGDGDEDVDVRGAIGQTVLSPLHADAKDDASLMPKGDRKRHCSTSSVRKTSLSPGHRRARDEASSISQRAKKRRYSVSSESPSSDESDWRASRSNLRSSPTAYQEMEKVVRFAPNGPRIGADDSEEVRQDEIVWLYGPLLGYKIEDGNPLVQVHWYPIWEAADEYPKRQVERVK